MATYYDDNSIISAPREQRAEAPSVEEDHSPTGRPDRSARTTGRLLRQAAAPAPRLKKEAPRSRRERGASPTVKPER